MNGRLGPLASAPPIDDVLAWEVLGFVLCDPPSTFSLEEDATVIADAIQQPYEAVLGVLLHALAYRRRQCAAQPESGAGA